MRYGCHHTVGSGTPSSNGEECGAGAGFTDGENNEERCVMMKSAGKLRKVPQAGGRRSRKREETSTCTPISLLCNIYHIAN
jgi:hypothetical protein